MKLREARKEELQNLLKVLEKHLPESINTYNTIKLGLQYDFLGKEGTNTHILIPDNDAKNASIVLITPYLPSKKIQSFTGYWVADKLTIEDVKELIESLPNWDWSRRTSVGPCCPKIMNQIEEVLQSNKFMGGKVKLQIDKELSPENSLYLYTLNREPTVIPSLPDGYEIRNMTKENVEYASKFYIVKDGMDPEYIYPTANKLGCLGVFSKSDGPTPNAQPVSWVLHHKHGAFGLIYTLDQHRRKGLATYVTYVMAQKGQKQERVPNSIIGSSNEPAMSLHRKLGFERTCTFSLKIFKPIS